MRLVIIESPFAGDVERNTAYARAALRHSLSLGEAPFASHLLYTQVLDDTKPWERNLGILAGLHWGLQADAVAVYEDLGVSEGMKQGLRRHEAQGLPVEYRTLPGWTTPSRVG